MSPEMVCSKSRKSSKFDKLFTAPQTTPTTNGSSNIENIENGHGENSEGLVVPAPVLQ